ncbi:hypothetical protein SMC26_30945 [Actinomadura fulvescens]|uniref:Uncharacterized protein n=1 Tax=Actinomadura fulvescens TaxID=46160 RepID=A0ABP6BKL7_9ACTN
MAFAAIGFRDHSGWGVLVAVGGEDRSPRVLLRERVELLADPDLPAQVYHAAVGLDLDEAAGLIAAVERSARAAARTVVGAALTELKEYDVTAVALGLDRGELPEDLATVLANHTLLHVGEGELYREALADAAAARGLRAVRHDFRSLAETAAPVLGADVRDRIAAWRREIGPPWARDHKDAALAAWLALATV